MSRPRKNIDIRTFEKLCALQCTEQEIADFLECSVDTLERWCLRVFKKRFAEVFAEKRTYGKVSLRRTQWALAEKSPAMAIFLGKNYLGQSDKVELAGNKDNPVKIETINLKKLSDDELQTLKIIAEKVHAE